MLVVLWSILHSINTCPDKFLSFFLSLGELFFAPAHYIWQEDVRLARKLIECLRTSPSTKKQSPPSPFVDLRRKSSHRPVNDDNENEEQPTKVDTWARKVTFHRQRTIGWIKVS